MTPCPKPKTIRLKGKAYTKFRKEVFDREKGLCQDCGQYVSLLCDGKFITVFCGHVSHIKSHGAGGGDTLDNVKWKCFKCHRKEHDKGAE